MQSDNRKGRKVGALSPLLLLLGLGGAIYLISRPAGAAFDFWQAQPDHDLPPRGVEVEVSTPAPGAGMTDEDYIAAIRAAGLNPSDYGYADTGAGGEGEYNVQSTEQKNLDAFMAVIRALESQNDYTALVGGGNFADFSDHPANLGWPGIMGPDGKTTAAGAYQITQRTWNDIAPKLGLTSFDQASQDAAAVGLMQRRNAYNLVLQGYFDLAMRALVNEWQALKRVLAGSYPYTLDQVRAQIQANGGTYA